MTSSVRRTIAATAATVLLAAAGVTATEVAAQGVEASAFLGGTVFLFDASETQAAVNGGVALICSRTMALGQLSGFTFSDWLVGECEEAVALCAADAVSNNRTLSGVRFATDSYACLKRQA
jgi:hypothetical protein